MDLDRVINAHGYNGFGNMFRKKEMGFCASSLERPCVKSERILENGVYRQKLCQKLSRQKLCPQKLAHGHNTSL